MRWFILILISANVALFFWLQYEELPEEPVLALPPPDIGRLELLREPGLAEDQPSLDTERTDRDAPPSTVPVPGVLPDNAPVELTDLAPVAGLAVPAPAEQSSDRESAVLPEPVPDPMSAAIPEARPERVVEPDVGLPTPVDVESLTMAGAVSASEGTAATAEDAELAVATTSLDEQQGEVVGEASEPDLAQEPVEADSEIVQQTDDLARDEPAAPPPAVASCARVGPLSPEDAEALIGTLPVFIQLLSDVTEEIVEPRGYYVMIPPLSSRAEGLQMLEDLDAAGITDTWLFPRGVYRNAISLGLFNRQTGALRRQQRVVAAGFDAEVIDRSSRREVRQLLLKNVDGGDIALSLPLPDGVAAESRPCP